jgi:hypothetical protein
MPANTKLKLLVAYNGIWRLADMLRRWLSRLNSKPSDEPSELRITEDDLNLYTLSDWGRKEQALYGFKARHGIDPWPLNLPLDWSQDPFKDTNWKFSLHSWRMTDPILREYFRTGNPDLLLDAFAFIEDWRQYHYIEKRTAEFSWYDMAAGIRALRIAFFINKIQSGELQLDASTVDGLYQMADDHALRLQDRSFIKLNNHGLFQVFGLHLLCRVACTRSACMGGIDFARTMYRKIFDGQFTPEGVHAEHSPHYHWFAERRISALASGNGIKDPHAEAILTRAREVLPWLTFPDGSLAAIGDSDGKSDPLKEVQQAQQRRLSNGRSYAIGDFTRSGYAVVRSLPEVPPEKQSMLFVMGMMHSYTHKHADDLSFELFEGGRAVLIDSGKYGYVKDSMRKYVESAAAHNTVSLETSEVTPRTIKPYGSALEPIKHQGDHVEIRGSIRRPGLFHQTRRLLYRPGDFLIVQDVLRSKLSERFVSSLHFAPDLELCLGNQIAMADLGHGRSVRVKLMDADGALEKARGQQNPILGWGTVTYLKMQPITTLRALCPNGNRTITWIISFNEAAFTEAEVLASSLNKAPDSR